MSETIMFSGSPALFKNLVVVAACVLAAVCHGYRTYTEALQRGCRCQSCGTTCSMVETEDHPEGGKSADTSQLPVRILDTNQNKWQHGYQPFDFLPDVTRFRLEFVCFVGEKVENLDVDISAFLFDAKGSYVETVGYGCPASTDGGIVHKHDSVQPEAGKISEDIDFDLSMVHKRIYSACLVATTYGKNTFSALRSIQLRILAPSHLLSDSLEREIARVVFSRVIPLVQCYLREWIPSIEVIGQELLIRRVYDIVSFLPVGDLEALRADWVKGGTFGVTKELFLGIMLRVECFVAKDGDELGADSAGPFRDGTTFPLRPEWDHHS